MESEGLHLDTSDLAAYLDDVLADVERARVEAHMAQCSECRHEVVEVARVRRTATSRKHWLVVIPVAVAAVLAIVLLRPPESVGPILRDGVERAPGVILLAPADSVVARTHQPFIWGSAGMEVSYRFTLSDANGDVVWSAAIGDTTLTLPAAMTLRSGRAYFWYVDALLPDGRSVTSGIRRLVAK